MSKSYRIRTQVGVDKSINVQLDQDFEFLEILSLKIVQSQVYTRPCSDYGVVIGRVSVNDGYGIPNCKVSVFIPISESDSLNPIISDLYPYQSLNDTNEDGYRYNLLPYEKSYSAHVPTGTFFTREDVLTNPTLFEIYDKYFKYTAVTNDSGDFMIFGVPVGTQTVHLDVDLSDIGEFSLSPQDLIRMGLATESNVAGVNFRSSSNLGTLPQIISINRTIEVEPFWGEPQICNLGITRVDFDLTEDANVNIQPTAIFMGSIFSDTDRMALKANCKPRLRSGELCNLTTGPGEILAIRQTIQQDINGRPILELFALDQGGQVIDENGTWLLDIPMNLDYVITNEFGQQVLSDDPKKGIPTKAKYRFKIKWNQSPTLNEDVKRAYFLVPNIREYGWDSSGSNVLFTNLRDKSYVFSLDWDDYVDPQVAINCEDTFYFMSYNKVYSVSQLMDQHRRGTLPNRFTSVKNILDDTCESENNRLPTNESVFRGDIIFLLFTFALLIFRPILYAMIFIIHVVFLLVWLLRFLLPALGIFLLYLFGLEIASAVAAGPSFGLIAPFLGKALLWISLFGLTVGLTILLWKAKLKAINLPILLYDQCEFCDCEYADEVTDDGLSYTDSNGNVTSQPPVLFNISGLQISQFQTNNYNITEIENFQVSSWSKMMAGEPYSTPPLSEPTCFTKVPIRQTYTDTNGDTFYTLSTSLTLAERINLFNTKAKYFDNDLVSNPGGGVNRIKVYFNSGSTNSHTDNVIFMMLQPQSASQIETGQLITFQDPATTKDINAFGTTGNTYGNNAITGSSTSISPFPKTINYANPNPNSPQRILSKTYIVIPNSADTTYHKFPIDIEYFQVITAMTYSQFSVQCGTQLNNSLNSRFLNNDMLFNTYDEDYNAVNQGTDNPLQSFDGYQNHICVFLVRGVDPYSSRQGVTYGLGRLFGFNSEDDVTVTGLYKLNQPIIGGGLTPDQNFLNIRHNIGTNDSVDTNYSNSSLYFQSFNYQPSQQEFSGFSSDLPRYYSRLDRDTDDINMPCAGITIPNINVCNDILNLSNGTYGTSRGKRVFSNLVQQGQQEIILNNSFTFGYNTLQTGFGFSLFPPLLNTSVNSRGYFGSILNLQNGGEIVEGGGVMIGVTRIPTFFNQGLSSLGSLISVIYESGYTLNYNQNLSDPNNRKLVMRSDRLPSSTSNNPNCGFDYLLQQNQSLGIFIVPDTGYVESQQMAGFPSSSTGPSDNTVFSSTSLSNNVVNSLNNCKDSVPLGCYYTVRTPQESEFRIYDRPNECYEDPLTGKNTWENGCYKLVTTVLISIPKDLEILTEWLARTNINFAACRNVFSHVFTNSWLNGSLYAFAFKNNKTFNELNQPTSSHCARVVYFDQGTNTFYYRSSPYFSGSSNNQYFVGRQNTSPGSNVQSRNLLYPTTLIDLGPRSNFLQEIIMTDDYDGYVMKDLTPTTFGDVTDLLNIFIISRLASSKFIELIFGFGGASIFNYFNKRGRFLVDGDYPQMISINSELGVSEFESENYPSIPNAQDPIYFNGGDSVDGVFGIFFSSDSQVRDFITPKRTIINFTGNPQNFCTFNYFNVFSQRVPFYQWEVKANDDYDSIFGSQNNTWYTNPINSSAYFSNFYQSLDRIDPNSRYFRTSTQGNQSYFKGYIYSVDSFGEYEPDHTSQDSNNPLPRVITVGSPFHFYFGLKKGNSAWDRFARKWIGFELVTS